MAENDESLDIAVLCSARALVGKSWRSAVSDAWLSGNYSKAGLASLQGRLQRLRNSRGPYWLARVQLPAPLQLRSLYRVPMSPDPTDAYLELHICVNGKGEYTTHVYNKLDQGHFSGHYFGTLADAIVDLGERIKKNYVNYVTTTATSSSGSSTN